MSNDHPHNSDDDPIDVSQGALDELAVILGDATMWESTDPADDEAIFAAISELAAADGADAEAPVVQLPVTQPVDEPRLVDPVQAASPIQTAEPSNVVPISSARRWVGPFAAGIAAALVLVLGASTLFGGSDPEGVELALASTDLAPDAEGVVEIVDTPNGTVLLLDVSGLPPAPEGSYYEAWLRQDAAVGVSAGTFHLRGGGGDIELWAGVTTDEYRLFTITIQDEADPMSSGRVVLKGLLGE